MEQKTVKQLKQEENIFPCDFIFYQKRFHSFIYRIIPFHECKKFMKEWVYKSQKKTILTALS